MSEPSIYFTLTPERATPNRCGATYSAPPMRAVTCTCVQDAGHTGDHLGFDRHNAVHSWPNQRAIAAGAVSRLVDAVDRLIDTDRIR